MVREEHDGVALEKLVQSARRLEQRTHLRIDLLERAVGLLALGTAGVRRKVVTGEVVGEKVEPVARDEPAPDRRCVRVG